MASITCTADLCSDGECCDQGIANKLKGIRKNKNMTMGNSSAVNVLLSFLEASPKGSSNTSDSQPGSIADAANVDALMSGVEAIASIEQTSSGKQNQETVGIAAEALNVVLSSLAEDEALPSDVQERASAALETVASTAKASSTPVEDAVLANLASSAAKLLKVKQTPNAQAGTATTAEEESTEDHNTVLSTQAAQEVSTRILKVTETIGEAAAIGLEEDAPPRKIKVAGLELTVKKPSANSFASGLHLEAFTLPSIDISSRTLEPVTVHHATWERNPYAWANSSNFSVAEEGEGVVQQLSLRDDQGEMKVSGLAEPVKFCLANAAGQGRNDSNVAKVSSLTMRCVFWDEEAGDWSTEGCVVDEASNKTQTCCRCDHLTSFAAAAQKALCKFCNVNLDHMKDPSKWFEIKWEEPGVYVVAGLCFLLYSPCILLACRDKRDWKQLHRNQGAYFKEDEPGSNRFECMLLPAFRLCFGFLKCAPVLISCPPRFPRVCKRLKKLRGRGQASTNQDVHADSEVAAMLKFLRQARSTQEAEKLAEAVKHLNDDMKLRATHAYHALAHNHFSSPKLASTDHEVTMHSHILQLKMQVVESMQIPGMHAEVNLDNEDTTPSFDIDESMTPSLAHKLSSWKRALPPSELQCVEASKGYFAKEILRREGLGSDLGCFPEVSEEQNDMVAIQVEAARSASAGERPAVTIQRWWRGFHTRNFEVPARQGKGLLRVRVGLRFTRSKKSSNNIFRNGKGAGKCTTSFRNISFSKDAYVKMLPTNKELPWGGESQITFRDKQRRCILRFGWEFWHQDCANLPTDVLFGQLRLHNVHVAFDGGVDPSAVHVDLEVSSGPFMHEFWDIPDLEVHPSHGLEIDAGTSHDFSTAEERWFRCWHFCTTPLLRVEALSKHRARAAFLCLPSKSNEKQEVQLHLQLLPENKCVHEDVHKEREKPDVVLCYSWELRTEIATWPQVSGALRIHSLHSKVARPSILVQTAMPADGSEHSVLHELNRKRMQTLNSLDLIGVYRGDRLRRNLSLFHEVPDWQPLAKRVQYMTWHPTQLVRNTAKRETPLNKCLNYSPLMTRKQRWAITSSAVLVAAFFSVLLFRVDCLQVPKPATCSPPPTLVQKMLSWSVLFASLWGFLLSVPVPLLLTTLFKKTPVPGKKDEVTKKRLLRLWLCCENLAWLIVVCLHVSIWFFILQFVRYYTWTVIEKWIISVFWSVFHRFISAPGIRATYVLILLFVSQLAGGCDTCLGRMPHITTFPTAVQPPPGHGSNYAREEAPGFTGPVQVEHDDDPDYGDLGDDEGD
eukprot:TRINITY_DN11573_c0_g1_i5.p1 TRINITY_DN11573_c0_g1~~TRINITY_DN11573_c0_g1_i5.p1  ORF type:complete len:1320 (-),score=272.19 TRINITY_DN11573_c0_g1_i5:282-4172(-)